MTIDPLVGCVLEEGFGQIPYCVRASTGEDKNPEAVFALVRQTRPDTFGGLPFSHIEIAADYGGGLWIIRAHYKKPKADNWDEGGGYR